MDQINSTSLDAIKSRDRGLISNSMLWEICSRTVNNLFALSKEREQLMLKVEACQWFDKNAKPVRK
jgi:hypothetical protein